MTEPDPEREIGRCSCGVTTNLRFLLRGYFQEQNGLTEWWWAIRATCEDHVGDTKKRMDDTALERFDNTTVSTTIFYEPASSEQAFEWLNGLAAKAAGGEELVLLDERWEKPSGRKEIVHPEDVTRATQVQESADAVGEALEKMGVPDDALPCTCANAHAWWTIGDVPRTLSVVQRALAADDFDPDEFDTRFFEPDGRWCPECGEPDMYCAETFGLEKRDPAEVRPLYAIFVDDGGTVYVDRRLDGASAQEN